MAWIDWQHVEIKKMYMYFCYTILPLVERFLHQEVLIHVMEVFPYTKTSVELLEILKNSNQPI